MPVADREQVAILGAVAAYRFVLCDVFAAAPLEGNALCVFTDARGLSDEQMQRLARETNLSETTFVLPAEGAGTFRIRIFTPLRELPFAGHPLVGTAVVLGRAVPLDTLVLETGMGPIAVDLDREGAAVLAAEMEQPVPRMSQHPDGEAICAALGLEARPVPVGDNGVRAAYVAAGSREALAALDPDHRALLQVDGLDVVSVYHDEGEVVRVRVFCPWAGIAEDPATGSAAGPLGVVLGRSIEVLQGVEMGRPSAITVTLAGDAPRVRGAVVVVGRGSYELP